MEQFIIIKPQDLEELVERSVRNALAGNNDHAKDTMREIMNAKEAAAFLNISISALYSKTSKRLIPHTKQGGLYFKRSELMEWLAQSKKLTRQEMEKGTVILKNNKLSKGS